MSFGVSYINNWSHSSCVKAPSLDHTDDAINMLDSKLQSLGAYRKVRYSNTGVYASDFIEDAHGGNDSSYVDSVDFFAYSGHGGHVVGDNSTFYMPLCGGEGNNKFHSYKAVWGEPRYYFVGGSHLFCREGAVYCRAPGNIMCNGKMTPCNHPAPAHIPGNLRWMMLLTPHSADRPYDYWARAAKGTKFEYLFGYYGNRVDSSLTDEVGYDWAVKAFKENWTFKAAWFYAVEDWWYDDIGTAVAFDSSCSAVKYRLNYFKASMNYPRSTGSGSKPPFCLASASHKG